MSVTPDPAELAPSRDPADYGRKPIFSRGFWAVMVLCLACILGGVAITKFGPRFFPAKSATPPSKLAPAARVSNTLPSPVVGVAAPVEADPPAVNAPGLAPSSDVGALNGRIERLEATQSGLADAAAAALAAAALSQATQSSGPFEEELAAVARRMPGSADVRALVRLARIGAPSRAALAADYRALSQKVAVAANAPAPDAGFLAQIGYAFSYIISIRRVEATERGVDTPLMRLEHQIADGDLEAALATIEVLPVQARERLVAWRGRAERRVEIDRRVAGIRAEALAHLERLTGPPRATVAAPAAPPRADPAVNAVPPPGTAVP